MKFGALCLGLAVVYISLSDTARAADGWSAVLVAMRGV